MGSIKNVPDLNNHVTVIFYKVPYLGYPSSSISIHTLSFSDDKLVLSLLDVSTLKRGVTTVNKKSEEVLIHPVFFIIYGILLRNMEKVLLRKVQILDGSLSRFQGISYFLVSVIYFNFKNNVLKKEDYSEVVIYVRNRFRFNLLFVF